MIIPVLESKRLTLIPVSLRHHSQDYIDWLNDPEVYRFMNSGGNYTPEMLTDFLIKFENTETLFWGIHLKEGLIHIGNIKIDPVIKRDGTGEYGIMIGRRSEWAKGYGKEASETVIDYCFKDIKLRKITLGVVAKNEAAVRLYQNLGFETERVFKKQCLYDNEYCDIIRMALFNPTL